MLPEVPRKPLAAGLSGTPSERRLNRLIPPPCAECKEDDTRVTLRTEYVIYCRCAKCGAVWSVPKPGSERFGT